LLLHIKAGLGRRRLRRLGLRGRGDPPGWGSTRSVPTWIGEGPTRW